MTWLAVAAGGATGACLRYLVTLATIRWYGEAVPLAVAIINIAGCLAAGAAAGTIAAGQWVPTEAGRMFVFAGVLGGFTTFSSFGLDTLTLMRDGRVALAAGNAILQLVLGVGAVFAGYAIASRT